MLLLIDVVLYWMIDSGFKQEDFEDCILCFLLLGISCSFIDEMKLCFQGLEASEREAFNLYLKL